ncbi:Thrombospondin 1 precursor [Labilithrix luteola]|uniref:Thrombospondin 1 n=1 Tax=Labilithrix luteola TaxID=1391654 RepID=A0A0K1Q452_9BACT|nr:hypothetical protein [Labilithrix luteola]AKV00509.1 Thrombospondin 1 precursor [Labilithrix luteola]
MKTTNRFVRWLSAAFLVTSIGTVARDASADDFADYSTRPTFALKPPVTTTPGFGTLYGTFSSKTDVVVDGYTLKGRIFAVDGGTIWLQKNYGASVWVKIASSARHMDPSFARVTPDGKTFAIGTQSGSPIFIGATSLFSVKSPPELSTVTGVKSVIAQFYDGVWRDNRYLFINAGAANGSTVYAIDASLADPASAFIPILPDIPGASSGLAFDKSGNFITGNGYTYAGDVSRTGQLKIWSAADIAAALAGTPLSYLNSGHVLADSILSAAYLGVDANNNLYVGGGGRFDTGDVGYAGLVSGTVITRVLAGGAPVNKASSTEYTEIAPDPCRNDDTTQVTYVEELKMAIVTAKMTSKPPNCAEFDDYDDPTNTAVQLYFAPDAPDTDGDGIPDGADNAWLTPNPDQTDSDGDGFGDVADADFNNDDVVDDKDLSIFVDTYLATKTDPNFDARPDFDGNGKIDDADYAVFLKYWGKAAPFY